MKNFLKKFKFPLLIVLLVLFSVAAVNFSRNDFEISKNLEIFVSLYKQLNTNYVDEINPGDLIKTAIDKMLESLDPYTTFIPESDLEDIRLMTTGQYGGIGAIIQQRPDYVVVAEPYLNFPAQKSGLRAGDRIIEINGESAKGKSVSDVSSALKGFPNTKIKITIERPPDNKRINFELTREDIKIKNVPYYGIIEGDIAYIKLSNFTFGAAREVRDAFIDLKTNHNASSVVIDLRGNGGGLMSEAVNIVNLFVPRNTLVVKTRGKLSEANKEYLTQFQPLDTSIPLVVLIDYFSASASEIVAGAIQDLDRGVVIGQQSFGKGLVQNVVPLSYNAKLKVTVAKYYIPSGRCIQAVDYSNRDSLGRVINNLNLPKEIFYTQNKRKVYDAGGIIPDIIIEPEAASKIVISLFTKNLIFDFATNFAAQNNSISSANLFEVNDKIFNQFVEFLEDKDYDYVTETEKKLNELKETSKDERYFDNISSDIEILMKKLAHNKQEDLITFRNEISEILGNEIVSRYHFQQGRIEFSLKFDKEINKAIEILKNNKKYSEILSPQKL